MPDQHSGEERDSNDLLFTDCTAATRAPMRFSRLRLNPQKHSRLDWIQTENSQTSEDHKCSIRAKRILFWKKLRAL
jgi:hypothetical protein